MSSTITGLHGPIYIERTLLEEALQDLQRVGLRRELGDRFSALERIGALLLAVNTRSFPAEPAAELEDDIVALDEQSCDSEA